MLSRRIPRTRLDASCLCLGTGDMGAGIDRQTSFKMLDLFLDQGGNFIDTAKIYSDWIPGENSRSEKLIGAWMKSRRVRGEVILASKGAHPELSTMNVPRLSPDEIASDLDASLENLQAEWIDLYWLHRDDPARPVEEIIDTLDRLMGSGKIQYYGCSNWSLERIRKAQEYAFKKGRLGFSAVQNLWNLAQVNPRGFADQTIAFMDNSLWRYHHDENMAAVPYTSQANGLFNKLVAASPASLPENLRLWFWNPVTEERFNRLKTLQTQTGFSTTQIVLGYLTSQPFPTFPIIGPKSIAQLEDCLSAGDVTLTEEQLEFLIS
jgi:aryl-alcohol dehydrogenase-like predicted oxidoreductase